MIKHFLLILCFISIVLFSISTNCYALDMEYYTYGGFEPIVNAFTKIALIFSDANYHALFFTVVSLGMLFGLISTIFFIAHGKKMSVLAWAIPVLLGVMVYFGLVVPKGNIIVNDPVVNRAQIISGIPDGIVALAGTLNLFETGVVDMLYTAATPSSHRYQDFAGGIGFNVLLKSTGFPLKLPNEYIDKSLRKYINDCLFFELMRPGTPLSVNHINSTSTNFLTEFSQAVNPAVFTVWYDDNATDRTGKTVSCTQAWTNLQAYLTVPGNFTDMLNYTCANSGFNKNNIKEMIKCRETLRAYIDVVFGVAMSITEEQFLRQAYMAKVLSDVLLQNDPDLALRAMANRDMMMDGIGAGVVANEWLPIIRAVVTSAVIGLIPFFVIFIPTPIFSRAVGIIVGFFVWLTAWGITDAVVHGLAMDLCVNAFERIRHNQLGLVSMIYFPDEATKALGVFGMMRTFGIMFATVFAAMLTKFGGHALAMMSSSMAGAVRSSGAGSATKALTPEGEAGVHNQLTDAVPTHAWANSNAFFMRVQAGLYDKEMRTGTSTSIIDAHGGINPAVSMGTHAARISNLESTHQQGVKGDIDGRSGGKNKGTSDIAGYQMSNTAADRYFGNKDGGANGQELLDYHRAREGSSMHMRFVNRDGYQESPKLSSEGKEVQTEITGPGFGVGFRGDNLTYGYSKPFTAHLSSSISASRLDSASHDIAKSISFSEGVSHGIRESSGHSIDKSRAEELSNSIKENISKQVAQDSSLKDAKDVITNHTLSGALNAGISGKLIIGGNAGSGYNIRGITSDGTKHSVSLSGKEAEDFSRVVGSSTANALRESMSSSQGVDDAVTIAKNTGSSEALRSIEMYKKERSLSDNQMTDLSTAYIKHFGDRYYSHIDNPKTRYAMAAEKIGQWAVGDPGEVEMLQNDYRNFSSKYFSLSSNEISSSLSSMKNEVKGFHGDFSGKTEGQLSGVDIDGVPMSDPRSQTLDKPDYGEFTENKYDFANEKIKEGGDSIPSSPIILLKHGQNYTDAKNTIKEYSRGPRFIPPPPPNEVIEYLNQKNNAGVSALGGITPELTVGPILKSDIRNKFGIKTVKPETKNTGE